MPESKDEKDNQYIKKVYENYISMKNMIVNELSIASKHGGITGSFREEVWIDMLRRIIPKKFSIAQSVLIIDSKGGISNEVDIAIYDDQYTPYIMQYGSLNLIPIEAVAIVVECKSTSYEPKDLAKWEKSISILQTNNTGIARMATGNAIAKTSTTQKSTRPISMLFCLKQVTEKSTVNEVFDFIIAVDKDTTVLADNFELIVPKEGNSLGWWAESLNMGIENVKVEKELEIMYSTSNNEKLSDFEVKGNPLLSLNFQLNQLLMLINNPMLFPHLAYVKMFEKYGQDEVKS